MGHVPIPELVLLAKRMKYTHWPGLGLVTAPEEGAVLSQASWTESRGGWFPQRNDCLVNQKEGSRCWAAK